MQNACCKEATSKFATQASAHVGQDLRPAHPPSGITRQGPCRDFGRLKGHRHPISSEWRNHAFCISQRKKILLSRLSTKGKGADAKKGSLIRIPFTQTVRKILQTIVCQAIPEQIKPFAAVILVKKKSADINPPILHRGQPGISVTAKVHLQSSPITQFSDMHLEPEPPAPALNPAPRCPDTTLGPPHPLPGAGMKLTAQLLKPGGENQVKPPPRDPQGCPFKPPLVNALSSKKPVSLLMAHNIGKYIRNTQSLQRLLPYPVDKLSTYAMPWIMTSLMQSHWNPGTSKGNS